MIPLGTLPITHTPKCEAVIRCRCSECGGEGRIPCPDCDGVGYASEDLGKSRDPKLLKIKEAILLVARQRDDLSALMPQNAGRYEGQATQIINDLLKEAERVIKEGR